MQIIKTAVILLNIALALLYIWFATTKKNGCKGGQNWFFVFLTVLNVVNVALIY